MIQVKNTDIEKMELRSEEFQDALGSVPCWILRWGIIVIAAIIFILLAGGGVFKYPDIIPSQLTLTGSTPPAMIVAKASGKLNELYTGDNHTVREGEYLAVIENPAETGDMLRLKEYLNHISFATDSVPSLLPKDLQLGSLQADYSAFYLALFEYSEYKRLEYYSTKAGIINERISRHEILLKNLLRQKGIVEKQLLLTASRYQRDSLLNRKGILSDEELENTENQYLQGILSYENITSSVDNSRIQIGQMKETLFDTHYQDTEKGNTLKSKLKTLIAQLYVGIHAWEQTYVLRSPINGKITFTNYWVENQNVTAGEGVFSIIPADSVSILGKASLPTARSGKVKTGQKVNIRFTSFPDNEYGIVRGFVKNISKVPIKDVQGMDYYMVEIELPDRLMTSYKKELPYLPEMTGQADIVTEDISLLERLVMPVRKAFNEGFEN
ncbi:MAG: HlyD family secretion protein [Prevotella sp.]|jgi:HlyD family secretion protein|nr:HlyD family secretion protein [Prevotella sp.]